MTKGGVYVALGYIRVVHGGRGDYVEFSDDQIKRENLHQVLYNCHDKNLFYDEFRTKDHVKVYHQFGYVYYADYKPGMWYISPADLDYTFPKGPATLDSFMDIIDQKTY